MGTAGFTSILNRTCAIQKQTFTDVDANGQPVGTFANVATDVPCRLEIQQRIIDATQEDPVERVVKDFNIMFESDAAITDDESCRIVMDNGEVFDVDSVNRGDDLKNIHHLEAKLKEVTS